jgi:serine/threonine protein phosphatase PrpC
MVSNFGIVDTLHNSNTAEACVSRLIQLALENGGRDNITVIACRIGKGEGE